MGPAIEIPEKLWVATRLGLAAHSQGRRESACVWAGKRGPTTWEVQDVIFLDDLPGTEGYQRYHRTPPEATARLFELLRSKGLQIVADVHTHPGAWVELSELDQAHPIEFRVGLIAVVLPYYAQVPTHTDRIGFHEYLGDGRWQRWPSDQVKERLRIQGV